MPLYCSLALAAQASSRPGSSPQCSKDHPFIYAETHLTPRLITRKQELSQCPPFMNTAITHSYSHSSPLLTVPGLLWVSRTKATFKAWEAGGYPCCLSLLSVPVWEGTPQRGPGWMQKKGQSRIRVSAAWAFRYKLWNPRTTLFQFS